MAIAEPLPRVVSADRSETSRTCTVTGLRIYAGAQALTLANAVAAVLAGAAKLIARRTDAFGRLAGGRAPRDAGELPLRCRVWRGKGQRQEDGEEDGAAREVSRSHDARWWMLKGRYTASSAMMHAALTMSSASAPRDRSLHGRASPCTMGPTASALARRCVSL